MTSLLDSSWIGGDPGPGPFSSSLGGLGFKRWIGQLCLRISQFKFGISEFVPLYLGLLKRVLFLRVQD